MAADRFQPYPHLAKRLRSAVVKKTGRRLADCEYRGAPYDTVCLLVRSSESSPWKVWDALYDYYFDGPKLAKRPRNLLAHDVDRVIGAYDDRRPDPLDQEREITVAQEARTQREEAAFSGEATRDAIAYGINGRTSRS